MAEKKKPFDDEFNTDEFDAFDDEDFNFDDDDDDPFQLDDLEENPEEEEEKSTYQFSEDEAESEEEAPEAEKEAGQNKFDPSLLLQNFIERLKNEEPRQLIKYGVIAFFVLLFLIGGLMKLFSTSQPVRKTTTTNPLSQPSIQPSSLQGNNSPQNLPIQIQGSASTLASLNNTTVTPINPEVSSPDMPSSSMPAQETSPTTPTTVPAVVNPAEMQQAATQNSSLTNHINQLDTQVAQLTQQVAVDAQMNASNQAQIASLIKSIDSMQSQMARLNNAMQTIVSAVGQSGNRQSGFMTGNNNDMNGGPQLQTAPDYYVQAVIPGRAWLKSSNGQIITVAVGDAIPGYGTVQTIDSQNGIVTTSTGSKIVFGIDEG